MSTLNDDLARLKELLPVVMRGIKEAGGNGLGTICDDDLIGEVEKRGHWLLEFASREQLLDRLGPESRVLALVDQLLRWLEYEAPFPPEPALIAQLEELRARLA